MKIFLILILAFTFYRCGGSKKPPIQPPRPAPTAAPTVQPTVEPTPVSTPVAEPSPSPIASPSVSPTPIARAKPTPYPVPTVDLTPYLHEQGGKVVDITIQPGEDVGKIINAADDFDGPGKLIVRGGGSIKTEIVTKHDVDVRGGEYYCDTEILEGCWLAKDNTKIEAFDGATVYEPMFFRGAPAITVFQTYASAWNNYASSRNVTIKGWKIVGRQTQTDGGVRQTISFGNCINCAAIDNELTGIASIGIQCGGGAAEGNHAENCLVYRNKLRRFAAAAIALVNVKGAIVTQNDMRDPGRKTGEPGGISGVDIESNNVDDCVKDILIFDNHIGYGNAAFGSIGNGILGQNVYETKCSGGLLVANNMIDGWEGRNGLDNSFYWGLSGGLYFVGQWPGGLVVNNTIIRAVQPGLSFYRVSGLTLQDNWFVSVGGGGSPGWLLTGSTENTFIRNRMFTDPQIVPGSVSDTINCIQNSGKNRMENLEQGWVDAECSR